MFFGRMATVATQQTRRRGARGFTLVEVIVTLAIVAISTAVVIPALGNITRADLRRTARGLSSTIRQAYDEAALSGQMQRIVFVVGDGQKQAAPDGPVVAPVRLETAEAALLFDQQGGAFVTAADKDADTESFELPPFADGSAELDAGTAPARPAGGKAGDAKSGHNRALGALAGINKLAQGDEEDNFKPTGTFALSSGVHVLDVWTEGMDQPLTDGEASLFFFAHGYTQNAAIHLEDANRNVFTVLVESLTGRTTVQDGYVEHRK
jgi:prepilin-type N-terminal cleavage/methylation domain-containing protein